MAHERAVFKAAAVVSDTKRVLKTLDQQGLTELRAMQKPDTEIEDLLAAIIIIGIADHITALTFVVSSFHDNIHFYHPQ